MPVPGRIARRAAALCSAAALAATLSAPPASAHESSLSLGANTASLSSDHTLLTVCDNENDGIPVYAEFAGHPLGGLPYQFEDSYGGKCSTYTLTIVFWLPIWMLCESTCVFTAI